MINGKGTEVLFMAITADEYELPIYVASTISEMAAALNLKYQTVSNLLQLKDSGRRSGRKIIKVVID